MFGLVQNFRRENRVKVISGVTGATSGSRALSCLEEYIALPSGGSAGGPGHCKDDGNSCVYRLHDAPRFIDVPCFGGLSFSDSLSSQISRLWRKERHVPVIMSASSCLA